MKKILPIIALLAWPLLNFATEVVISGKVKAWDNETVAGAVVTITCQDDYDAEPQKQTLDADGQYSFSFTLSQHMISTRLYDLEVELGGYGIIEISKVISKSFRLEDIYLLPEFTEVYKPRLPIIAQSEAGHNIVAWERTAGKDISYYIVLRKNESGIFDSIGKLGYDEQYSLFIDSLNTSPAGAVYQIQAVYTSGGKSLPSNTAKSFKLQLKESNFYDYNDVVYEIEFEVDLFDGVDYPAEDIRDVELYRSADGGEFRMLIRKNADELDYQDVLEMLPPDSLKTSGRYTYKIVVNYKDECLPERINGLKSDSGPFSQSISNLAEAIISIETVGNDTKTAAASMDPVPATNGFTVRSKGKSEVAIYSVTMEPVYKAEFTDILFIDTRTFYKGLYIVSVKSAEKTESFRQIVE
jgi:hypothetical protein